MTKADFEAFGDLMQKVGEAKAHIEALAARAESAEARAERYRMALAELVACRDEEAALPDKMEHSEYEAWCAKVDAAWDAARAALRGEG